MKYLAPVRNSLAKTPLLANLAYRHYVLPRPRRTRRTHFLVACMPKSGSTYLTTLISQLAQIDTVCLVSGYGRREQELDIGIMRAAHHLDYVAHHHVRYSDPTATLLRHFCVKPVVQIRNIFDVVISLRDHFRKESVEGSMGYVTHDMLQWENAKLERFITQMIIPWYFNFYISWLACDKALSLTYAEVTECPEETLSRICSWASLKFSANEIAGAVKSAETKFTRKNVGITGRGQNVDAQTRQLIREMAAYYNGVNFAPLGL